MKAENYIREYLAGYQNNKDCWNYEDGCILIGARQLYEATGEESYFVFIETYLRHFIMDDGTIAHYQTDKFNFDSINAGKILFFMYEKTGEEKYRKAIEVVMDQLRNQPGWKCGSSLHKQMHPNQIRLEGLYMTQPFYMEYETKFDKKEQYNDIIRQFENVQKYGCSSDFRLRSIGWYLMALVDTMDAMSIEIYEQYRKLQDIFKLVLKGILRYQDEKTGLFYQVIDRSDAEGNYLETSGNAMIGYSIMKACRMGILLKEKYEPVGTGIFESLIENNPQDDYYLSGKIVDDDPKGVGAFMMAYAQYLQLKKEIQ